MKLKEIDWRGDVEKMLTQSPKGFANMNYFLREGIVLLDCIW